MNLFYKGKLSRKMSLNYSPNKKALSHTPLTPIKINFFSPSPAKLEKQQEPLNQYLKKRRTLQPSNSLELTQTLTSPD